MPAQPTTTYERDFAAWLHQTEELLRQGRWSELDVEHLLEEIEDLGKRERRALSSQLTRLLVHLLKWQFQPERRSDSWLDSIADARLQIALAIEDSPSLGDHPAAQLQLSYRRARQEAMRQMGLSARQFPADCPYAIAQILECGWLP
jgi:hypothetical protein